MKILKRHWKKLILILLFAGLFFQYDYRAPKRNFSDFHVPYVTAKRLLNNEAIYTFKGGLSYYKYPALYAFLMTPLTYLSERNAARLWFLINFVFLCVIFYISLKIIELHPTNDPVATIYFIIAMVSFRFILQNLHEGQANLFMLFLLLSGLYSILNHKETLGSFLLAGSIMLKYMPILFLPYFLLKKRFGLVAKVIFFIIMLTFLPTLLVGLDRMLLLLKQQLFFLFPSSMDDYSTTCYHNQSLLACLNRFIYGKSWFSVKFLSLGRPEVLIIFFIFAGILYSLALIPKGRERFSFALDFALVILCMALFNPNAWMNFFVLIIFPYAVIIYYLTKVKNKDKWVLAMFLISFILNSLTSEFFVRSWAGNNFEICSSVTFGTLVLFAALIKIKFFSSFLRRQVNA